MSAAGNRLHDTRASTTAIMAAVATEPDNLSGSEPAAKGLTTGDTLSAIHRDVTRALGLVLATSGVEEALRAAGRWDGARRVLHRHLEIARGES